MCHGKRATYFFYLIFIVTTLPLFQHGTATLPATTSESGSLYAALEDNLEEGKFEDARRLLNRITDVNVPDNRPNSRGGTYLHYAAAYSSSIEIVKRLLRKGARVDLRDDDNQTPLHSAALSGSSEITRLLLNHHKGTTNKDEHNLFINAKDNDGYTPLHCAVISDNSIEIIKVLLKEGSHVNTRNNKGQTPLHSAARSGSSKITRLLLHHHKDTTNKDEHNLFINAKDDEGKTPLDYAALSGTNEIIKLLVEEDSLLNTRDKEKQTPLLIAKQHEEKQDTIAYLIEMTPPALDRKDAVKSTPLRAAIVPRAEEKSMMTIVTFQNVLMVISIAGLLSLAWYRLCKKKGRPQEEKL